MKREQTRMPRRTFLAHATAGAGLIFGGLGCATAIIYPATVVNGRIRVNRSELQALAHGQSVVVKAPGLSDPLILTQLKGDEFVAVSAKCTHLGCHVRASQNFLVCPCHGSTFDPAGDVVRGPAQEALARYPVEVTKDQVEIIMP